MSHSSVVVNRRPPPPPAVQINSLTDFNVHGSLSSAVPGGGTIGVTSVLSLACWVKQTEDFFTGGTSSTVFSLSEEGGGNNNYFEFKTFRSTGGQPTNILVEMRNSSGSVVQDQQWGNVLGGGTNSWHHFVFTWDGSGDSEGAKLYVDGVDAFSSRTAGTNTNGNAITDTARDIFIGGNQTADEEWIGPIYSCALYDTILSPSEVSVLYNGGNAAGIDLEENFGAYQSAANMIHYYRPGIGADDTDFGTDLGVGSPLINLENSSITTGALSQDIPEATGDFQGYTTVTADFFENEAEIGWGAGAQHTVMAWVRRTSAGDFGRVLDFNSGGTDNRKVLTTQSTAATPLNHILYAVRNQNGSSATALSTRVFNLNTAGPTVPWDQLTFSYNFTTGPDDVAMTVHHDGVDITNKTTSTGPGDPNVSLGTSNPEQTDLPHRVGIGGNATGGSTSWTGSIYYIAVWSNILTTAEIVELHASGSPAQAQGDPTANFGDYVSASSLIHFWNFADESDRGKDLGDHSGVADPIDIDVNSEFINEDSFSLADYPGSPGD